MEFLKKKLSTQQKRFLRSFVEKMDWLILPFVKSNLNMLAHICNTDKLQHGYIPHYKSHFQSKRRSKLNVLEIGIKDGASLKMWKYFFPNSKIYGVDIEDVSCFSDKRVKIYHGDQNSPDFLNTLVKEVGRFDIIIDDGSHVSEHVITSFNTLFPWLKEGGIYVVEDLHTSYWKGYGGRWQNLNDPKASVAMLKTLVDGLNFHWIPGRQGSYTDKNIVALHFYPKIAFIVKNMNYATLRPDELKNIEDSLSGI